VVTTPKKSTTLLALLDVCDCRRGIDWILALLTPLGTTSNYSATSDLHTLQLTTAPAKPSPVCSVINSPSLATASNSANSSASRAQFLFLHLLVKHSRQFLLSQLTTINLGTLNPILCCSYLTSRCHLFSVISSVGLGSSL
jgi:hypothetical protein